MNKEKYNYKEFVETLIEINDRIENSQGVAKDEWRHYLQGYIRGADSILKD